MVPCDVGTSSVCRLSEILYFYHLEEPRTFGVPNRILRDAGRELWTVPRKQGAVVSLNVTPLTAACRMSHFLVACSNFFV